MHQQFNMITGSNYSQYLQYIVHATFIKKSSLYFVSLPKKFKLNMIKALNKRRKEKVPGAGVCHIIVGLVSEETDPDL